MKKNDELTVRIEDISVSGEGIGRAEGMVLFVKDTVPGDLARVRIMKMKKTYGYARLMELLEASQDRVEPRCPSARSCGGCQLQHMSYARQLQFKTEKVRNNLMRIGGFDEALLQQIMEPIIGMEDPWRYRNKAQFPVGKDSNGHIVTGFYAGRTHRIIPNRDCVLGIEENQEILDLIIAHMEQYHIEPYDESTGKGLVRHVLIRSGYSTGELLVCLIINGTELPYAEELADRLFTVPGMTSLSLNVNRSRGNRILGEEVILLRGRATITDTIGAVRYQISPISFFQVNPVQTEKLYATALEYAGLTGGETVWDLYCGIGTISLFLAQKAARVYGVEIVPEAVRDAESNAELNGFGNTRFFAGKAEEILPEFYENERQQGRKPYADVMVVDPPRKGCDAALLETMLKMRPERIVYVSCDSATLARDLKILAAGGYELRRVRAADMFPQGVHVETVVLMSKKDK